MTCALSQIPSSAVEMPGGEGGALFLDVQFGALEPDALQEPAPKQTQVGGAHGAADWPLRCRPPAACNLGHQIVLLLIVETRGQFWNDNNLGSIVGFRPADSTKKCMYRLCKNDLFIYIYYLNVVKVFSVLICK